LPDQGAPQLEASRIVTGYGSKRILDGVDIHVGPGEVVALIGHNGAGKSTLLKAVFGLLPLWKGSVRLKGVLVPRPSPRELLSLGVAYVPQGNRVFTDLSVGENLDIGCGRVSEKRARIERTYEMFPSLKDRLRQRAGTLSGGEKQMLALANALVTAPQLLLLDEPSLGLAPPLVSESLGRIREISIGGGVSVLIVEQKVREVLHVADRVYVLRNGQVSFTGSAEDLRDETLLRNVYL